MLDLIKPSRIRRFRTNAEKQFFGQTVLHMETGRRLKRVLCWVITGFLKDWNDHWFWTVLVMWWNRSRLKGSQQEPVLQKPLSLAAQADRLLLSNGVGQAVAQLTSENQYLSCNWSPKCGLMFNLKVLTSTDALFFLCWLADYNKYQRDVWNTTGHYSYLLVEIPFSPKSCKLGFRLFILRWG